MAIVYAIFSAFFAALVAIFAKIGLQNLDSTLATAIRSVIMAVVIVGFVIITGKVSTLQGKSITSEEIVFIVLSGLAGAASWLFYFQALKIDDGNTTRIVAIDKLSIVFVAVLALLILKDKLSIYGIAGVILMTLGAVLLTIGK